jgi:hypothetical protein
MCSWSTCMSPHFCLNTSNGWRQLLLHDARVCRGAGVARRCDGPDIQSRAGTGEPRALVDANIPLLIAQGGASVGHEHLVAARKSQGRVDGAEATVLSVPCHLQPDFSSLTHSLSSSAMHDSRPPAPAVPESAPACTEYELHTQAADTPPSPSPSPPASASNSNSEAGHASLRSSRWGKLLGAWGGVCVGCVLDLAEDRAGARQR